MTLEELEIELSKKGINLSSNQISKLDKYLSYMLEYNEKVNLTAITDKAEGIEKHLYDSLLVATTYDLDNKNIIDIGSGAGLPGIPLAILYPNSKFTLLEPINKKANFLKSAQELLDLGNVTVICDRSENLKSYQEKFDVAISRAVARLNILLEISCQLIKVNGVLIAMKAKQGEEELLEAKNALKQLGFALEKNNVDSLPISKEIRNNIVIKKNSKTKNKYPRPYNEISRRPL